MAWNKKMENMVFVYHYGIAICQQIELPFWVKFVHLNKFLALRNLEGQWKIILYLGLFPADFCSQLFLFYSFLLFYWTVFLVLQCEADQEIDLKKKPKQNKLTTRIPPNNKKQIKQKPTAVAFRLDHLNGVCTVGAQPSRRRLVSRHQLVCQQKRWVSWSP